MLTKNIAAFLLSNVFLIVTASAQAPEANPQVQAIVQKANDGDQSSMNMMGNLYKSGSLGLTKNPLEAKKWFEKAAQLNYAPSLFNLGLLYENGAEGINQDIPTAKNYYESASKLGFKKADERLANLGQSRNNDGKIYGTIFNNRWSDGNCKLSSIEFGDNFPMGIVFLINQKQSPISAPARHSFTNNQNGMIVLKYQIFPNSFVTKLGIPQEVPTQETTLSIRVLSPKKLSINDKTKEADANMLLKGQISYKETVRESTYSLCE